MDNLKKWKPVIDKITENNDNKMHEFGNYCESHLNYMPSDGEFNPSTLEIALKILSKVNSINLNNVFFTTVDSDTLKDIELTATMPLLFSFKTDIEMLMGVLITKAANNINNNILELIANGKVVFNTPCLIKSITSIEESKNIKVSILLSYSVCNLTYDITSSSI